MDLPRRLRRARPLRDGPGAHLFGSGGQITDQPEQRITLLHQFVKTALADPEIREEQLLFLALHFGEFRLDLRADGDDPGALGFGVLFERDVVGVALVAARDLALGDVGDVDDGFERQERRFGEQFLFVVGKVERAGAEPSVKPRLDLFERGVFRGERLVVFDEFGEPFDPAVDNLEVREDQLEVDGLDVADGIDAAVDVNDIVVVEAADDVNDRVALADVGEELIAQTLALRRAAHQPRDVDELDDGGGVFFGVIHFGENVQPLVRDGDDADVGVDRAEGIVGGLRARVGQRVEERALPHVRKSDDAEFHSSSLSIRRCAGSLFFVSLYHSFPLL